MQKFIRCRIRSLIALAVATSMVNFQFPLTDASARQEAFVFAAKNVFQNQALSARILSVHKLGDKLAARWLRWIAQRGNLRSIDKVENKGDVARRQLQTLYENLESNFGTLTAGELFVKGETRLPRMASMFPEGRPLETDIWGVAIQDFPQKLTQVLNGITDEWMAIWPADKTYFRAAPSTYHINLIVPQDLPNDPNHRGILGGPENRLSSNQLNRFVSQTFAIARGLPSSIRLIPKGLRMGDDGALIVVFDYEPNVATLKERLAEAVKRVKRDFFGRPKPMIHITLFRPLENLELDEETVSRMKSFGQKYRNTAPSIERMSIPDFTVRQIHVYHETQWMHTKKDFDMPLYLGKLNFLNRLKWTHRMHTERANEAKIIGIQSSLPGVGRTMHQPYRNGTLPAQPYSPHVSILEIKNPSIDLNLWPALSGEPFTTAERERFESGEGVIPVKELTLEPNERVVRARSEYYDRQSGEIRARLILETDKGEERRKLFVLLTGSIDSSINNGQKALIDYASMRPSDAYALVLNGNLIDMSGHFSLKPAGGTWNYVGPVNEPWANRVYTGVVALANDCVVPGHLRLEGDSASNTIRQVYFRPLDGRKERLLKPDQTRFVLTAFVVEHAAEQYGPADDWRHFFRLPYYRGAPIFYAQILGSSELFAAARRGELLSLSLPEGRTQQQVAEALNGADYRDVQDPAAVREPGQFAIVGVEVHLRLLTARYPLSALVVSRSGRIALLQVSGASGRAGADYRALPAQIQEWIYERLKWSRRDPYWTFILGNGMDMGMQFYENGKVIWDPQPNTRPTGYAALSFHQRSWLHAGSSAKSNQRLRKAS